MKRLLVILLSLITVLAQAQVRIGEREAYTTAEQFLSQQGKSYLPTISEEIKSQTSGQTNLFVFSLEPQGFVIVSALGEVLAYSFESGLPHSEKLPEHIAYWIDLYNRQTDVLLEHPELARKPSKGSKSVEPLLTSAWGQGCYYNETCPNDNAGPCQHVSAGCVAIAMAQIMYFHKHPVMGNGTMSYSCSTYGTLSANFGQTTYHWDAMADTLHDQNPAVATLVSHCGISVKMQYGVTLSLASHNDAVNAFQQFFSYPAATLSSRAQYNEEDWLTLIKEDLDKRHPVYYSGSSWQGGHAFVCDGYDNNGLFHFNFGWNGVADGYFTLNDPSGFSNEQAVIRCLFPFSNIAINGDSHRIIYVAPDGMGDGSSWEHATNQLQMAIYKCHLNNYTIWVKEGTYHGFPLDEYAFTLLSNTKIYGGFQGDEPYNYDLSLRNFEAHPSILDGNHTQGVVNAVPYFNSNSTIIDGFVIRNGQSTSGGGIVLNNHTRLRNCKICYNTALNGGGGITQQSTFNSEDIVVEDCEIFNNEARNGGGIQDRGNTVYRRCQIHDNHASGNGGGIHLYNNGRQSRFIGSSIYNNSAQIYGGGLSSSANSRASFWSCLINNNSAQKGGGGFMEGGETNLNNCTIVKNEASSEYGGIASSPITKVNNDIKNCIIWGNVSPDEDIQIGPSKKHLFCAVQNDNTPNNYTTVAENDGDSLAFYVRFKNPCDMAGVNGHGGDWRLQSNSLCIDRVNSITGQPDTDLEGNPRLRHGGVDIGAYESDVSACLVKELLCDGSPYHYNGQILYNPGLYTFPFQGPQYDSLVILQLSYGQSLGNATLTRSICEGEEYIFYGTSLQESGHYYTRIICDTIFLDLTVNPIPSLQCSNDTLVDYGAPVHLFAKGAESYLWSTGDTTSNIIVYPKEDKTYTVTGFINNSCSDMASVSVRVNKNSDNMILYPNPANDIVTINMFELYEVEVFDPWGVRVAHVNADRQAVDLDVRHLASGVYIVHVRQLNNHHYKKLVIGH